MAKELDRIYEARDGPHATAVADVARLVGSVHLAQGKALLARTAFQKAYKVYGIALGALVRECGRTSARCIARGALTRLGALSLGKGHKKTQRVAGILETLEPAAEEAAGKWLT